MIKLFLRENGVVIGCGLIAGLAGAVAGARLLQTQLFGVTPLDPLTIIAMSVLLGAVGLLATLWPATRASSQNLLLGLKEGEAPSRRTISRHDSRGAWSRLSY